MNFEETLKRGEGGGVGQGPCAGARKAKRGGDGGGSGGGRTRLVDGHPGLRLAARRAVGRRLGEEVGERGMGGRRVPSLDGGRHVALRRPLY